MQILVNKSKRASLLNQTVIMSIVIAPLRKPDSEFAGAAPVHPFVPRSLDDNSREEGLSGGINFVLSCKCRIFTHATDSIMKRRVIHPSRQISTGTEPLIKRQMWKHIFHSLITNSPSGKSLLQWKSRVDYATVCCALTSLKNEKKNMHRHQQHG